MAGASLQAACIRVRALLTLLAALLVARAVSPTPVQSRDDRAFVQSLVDRTVQVKGTCPDPERGWTGSGVWMGSRSAHGAYLATAAHVLPEAEDLAAGCVLTVGGVELHVRAQNEGRDLALLWAPGFVYEPLVAANPYLGMPVIAVGYPAQPLAGGTTALSVSRGVVLTVLTKHDYRVSASIYYGSSGGPLFDEQGRLVGITVGGRVSNGMVWDDQYLVAGADWLFEQYNTPL